MKQVFQVLKTVSSGSFETEQEGEFQACTLIFVWVGTCDEVG